MANMCCFIFRGCVSGQQIENMREMLDKDGSGDYQWDMLDGWEELE